MRATNTVCMSGAHTSLAYWINVFVAAKLDFGSMVSGVIRGKGVQVTKGYSIHLKDNVYVNFDAEQKKFIKAWKNGDFKNNKNTNYLNQNLHFPGYRTLFYWWFHDDTFWRLQSNPNSNGV